MGSERAHELFVRQAIALAGQARREGNHPFGALLVLGDDVVLTATIPSPPTATRRPRRNQPGGRAIRELTPERSDVPCSTPAANHARCAWKMYWAGIRAIVCVIESGSRSPCWTGLRLVASCPTCCGSATVTGPMLRMRREVHAGFGEEAMDFRLKPADFSNTRGGARTLTRFPILGPGRKHGTWSAFDVVGHLIHGERTDWMPRVDHILKHGDAVIFPVSTAKRVRRRKQHADRASTHSKNSGPGVWLA
jgi:tRNA(Arg) A34 adenosine deaminase TadA